MGETVTKAQFLIGYYILLQSVLLCSCVSVANNTAQKQQLISLYTKIDKRLKDESSIFKGTGAISMFSKENSIQAMKDFKKRIDICSPTDYELIAEIKKALTNWFNQLSLYSFVSFIIIPDGKFADIKYQNILENSIKTARENPSQIKSGTYQIWAEIDGKVISNKNNTYDILSRKEKITIKRLK